VISAMLSSMLYELLNHDFRMAPGMMERNVPGLRPYPPTVYYSVTDESGVTCPE
jgi:hypothetical protein